MPVPILAAKLFLPPPPPGAIPRPRLIERLNQGLSKGSRLTLISAPAGFGKSTLASQWLFTSDHPVAWLSLEEEDNDPLRFITYLVASLQTIKPEIVKGLLISLQSPQPPQVESLLAALVNEIGLISENFILVLDDYHSLDSQPVDNILTFLLKHQSPRMHLVIATREDPQLPLTRLRARGQLTELRAADLRFTPAEAADFLNQVIGLNLSSDHIAALEKRTEGWIAGLQLAAISMQGHEDVNAFIQSFTGSHRFVLDYLVEEVLQKQPDDVQSFLLLTSILDRMCGSLCDAVLEYPPGSGQKMLETIEQANLFVIPLDSERLWYRYHHLFAELLRQRLEQSLSKEEIAFLQIRASEWYEHSGQVFEAFRYAAAANDVERAERLIENREIGLHMYIIAMPILNWLDSLPNEVRDARPKLWLRSATLGLMAGQTSGVEHSLQRAEEALRDVELTEEIRDLIGQIASARATLALMRYDPETMLSQANRALDYLHPENWTYLFNASWALATALRLKGDRAAAALASQECIEISRKSPSKFSKILAAMTSAILNEFNNRLFEAAEEYRHVLELYGDHPQPNAGEVHLGLARIHYQWNNLEAAEQHAKQSLQLTRQFDPTIDRYLAGEIFLARLKLAHGDLAGAAGICSQAEQTARKKNFSRRLPEIAAVQVLIHLRRSDLPAAAETASQFDLPLSQSRVLLAQGDFSAAQDLLVSYLELVKSKSWVDEQLKAMVILSLAHYANGEKDKAVGFLADSLAIAEPGGFIRLFVDEGEPMAQLLTNASSRSLFPKYIDMILAAFKAENAERDNSSARLPGNLLTEPLSQRELEVMRLISQGLSNHEIGARLFLALDTVKGHNRRIFDKLQVHSRTEAIARARELGIL